MFRVFVFQKDKLVMKEQQHLKEFVSKLIEKRATEEVPHLYIVDKQTGPYRSIQQAIDDAEPNSLIKISEGFYEENLIITKPLKFQPKTQSQEPGKIGVILLVSGGIGVTVKLPYSDQKCEITGMKFSHSGNSQNVLRNELMQHQHILNIFQHTDNIDQLEMQFVNRMSPNKMQNIGILLQKGKMLISKCMISLNYLVKSCSLTIPAIWVEKEGNLHIVDSEIKGNDNKSTIGVISRLGTVYIESSTICNHKQGGVVLWGIKGNLSKIIKNFIQLNSIGVSIVGEEFKPKIISNSINKNKIGIKVGLASEPEISRNIIVQSEEGIQINSAFPSISLNKIQKSKVNGIACRSYKRYLCRAIISKNVGIAGNGMNGILIHGQNNHSIIVNNHLIGFNGQAGIRVEKMSYPTINKNKIYKNYREGILVVQNSNAIIQRNEITHNIECNIAIGGINSHHSAIVQNSIEGSPGVGIFCVDSGRLKVIRNDICRNLDGIIIQNGEPQLRRNHIAENKNNGVVCQGESFPLLVENFITRNAAVGLLFRQKISKKENVINSNIVVSNEIDSALQEYDKQTIDELNQGNTIQTEIYYPESLPCKIM